MPSEPLVIRSYQRSDREEVWNLHKLALEAVGSPWKGPLAARLDQEFADINAIYLNNGGEFLVGRLHDRIIAMGALKRLNDSNAEITRMRVHPDFWRRGYAQIILDHLEERAMARGYRKVWLDLSPIQTFAQQLYLKNGYREYSRVMLGTAQLIVYEKDLGDRRQALAAGDARSTTAMASL